MKYRVTEDMLIRARIPKRYWLPDVTKIQQGKHLQFEVFNCQCFLLYGASNMGKTFTASLMANISMQHGISCLFVRASEVLDFWYSQIPMHDYNLQELHRRVGVLILDDLGAEATNERSQATINQMLTTRGEEGKTTIVTTTPEVLSNQVNYRLINKTLDKWFVKVALKKNKKEGVGDWT